MAGKPLLATTHTKPLRLPVLAARDADHQQQDDAHLAQQPAWEAGEEEDLTSKMQMKMKLFTLKMKEEDSVMSHIAEFKKIVADLVSMEVKYDDEDLGLLLLCSLPNSYANFRDTILLSRDELTLKEVYEALPSREKMRGMVQNDEMSSSKGDALHVRGRTKNRSSNDGNDGRKNYKRRGRSKSKPHGNKKLRVYCKLTNHNVEDCEKMQNKEKRKNKSPVFASDHVPEKELQRMRMQVEHVDDDTGVQVEPVDEHGDHDNDVAEDDAHDDVQQTPPILQLEEDLPIAQRKSKRIIAPPKRLIEECNLSYYALSCAEQVENVHEPATYKEAIRCGDTENWISAMHEEMRSLEKNSTWEIGKSFWAIGRADGEVDWKYCRTEEQRNCGVDTMENVDEDRTDNEAVAMGRNWVAELGKIEWGIRWVRGRWISNEIRLWVRVMGSGWIGVRI
ncbi:unnamed protein product [Miscanthus lutarioriparius]|uniref:Retrotransposon protein, putative, Ty1-copia subclass n=1 Tax=Miscanthus lutarioriparius TaxID=422564 RepID=A0A811PDM5_9POAL|nr:unnamed protein product [Miscanthus lutarioriparius]